VRPSLWQRYWELRGDGDALYATLRVTRGLWRRADIDAADGTWRFRREGFFRSRILAHAPGFDNPVATARFASFMSTRKATIELAIGRRYTWKLTRFFRGEYALFGDSETPILVLRRTGLFRMEGRLEMSATARSLEEAPLLVTLVWYLRLLRRHKRHAALIAAAAASG
jgi:hypothetical protein